MSMTWCPFPNSAMRIVLGSARNMSPGDDGQCVVQDKAAAASMPTPSGRLTGKLYLTPKTLSELFSVLEQYANQQDDFRVIAGNTGAGVYHDWPLEKVLIDIKGIPDLARIETSKVQLVLIAAMHVWLE